MSGSHPQVRVCRRRIDPSDQLFAAAAGQGGVVGAAQFVPLDFTLRSAERLVHQRSWVRLATGVYQVGVGEPSWEGLAWAGVLLGGPRARLGFEAAGHLWKIIDEPPPRIASRASRSTDRRSRPLGLPAGAVGRPVRAQPGSPPRTTIEDTVVDLCTRAESRAVPGLLTRAVQGRRTTAQRILACVDDRARVRHRDLLREMLGDVAQGAESPLELRYLTEIERPHGLPVPSVRFAVAAVGRFAIFATKSGPPSSSWMDGFTSLVVSATWSATMRPSWAATSPCDTDGPTSPSGRARWPGRLPPC